MQPKHSDASPRSSSPDWAFAAAVTVAFAVACGILTARHEPWRDEMQAWLLARDSASIPALLAHLKYEGHPPLWHTCLFLLQRTVSANPAIMQGFNWLLATAAVAVVALFAPFGRLQRALFGAGYFPLYMYGVIARDYALTLLLIVIACALFGRRSTGFVGLTLALCLLTQTSVFGLIVCLTLTAAVLLERIGPNSIRGTGDPRAPVFWAGLSLIAVAIVAAIVQLNPPPDTGYGSGWHFALERKRFVRMLLALPAAFFPLQHFDWGFWSRPILYYRRSTRILGIAGAFVIAAWTCIGLSRRRLTLWVYVAATGGLLSFFYIKYPGELNHHGFLFVVFVASLWIFLDEARATAHRSALRPGWWDASLAPVLTAVLIFQAIAAWVPAASDFREVFSYGRTTAAFLRQSAFANDLLVAHRDATASAVLGFLPGRTAFFPASRRFGTFVVWDTVRLARVTDADIVARAESVAATSHRRAVLLLDHALDSSVAGPGVQPLTRFTGSLVRDEDYYLYLLGGPTAP